MKEKTAYQRIAGQIELKIRSGELKAGERLASIRQLAKTEGVSINTIRTAMDVLSQTVLIVSQPRRGLMVAMSDEQPDYQPFEHFEPDAKLAQQTREWLNTAVTPAWAANRFVNMIVPPENAMFKSFQRHYRQSLLSPPRSAVEVSSGNILLREKIAQRLLARQCRINPADIQITNGCQNATEHALRVVTDPGDVVAVPTPAFPGYLALMSMLNLKTIELPMTPCGPDPKVLKKVMHSKNIKALIINPICHNPTGGSINDDYKRDVALWAARNKVAVIEDDICAELSFYENHPRPIVSFDKDGWVLLVSSISKLMGDSERIGWCYPGRFKDLYMTQFAISQIGSSFYRQKALAMYMNGSRFDTQLRQWRKQTRSALDAAIELLTSILGDQIQITPPRGGYALWIRLPDHINAKTLRQRANKQNLDFLPGDFFSLDPRFKNYLRLVIVPPFDQGYQKDLRKLAKLIRH